MEGIYYLYDIVNLINKDAMKRLMYVLMIMIVGNVYSQGIDCTELFNPKVSNLSLLDSLHSSHVTYRVQVLSMSVVDKNKFGRYLRTHRCEVDYCLLPNGKEVYRYMISPKTVNSIESALELMIELSRFYENPFIVIYHNGKRIN